MVTIDLQRLNAASPYPVSRTRGGDYTFRTDTGVRYFVSFLEDDLLQNVSSYQIIIANPANRKSPRDPKLRDTILALVYAFFDSTESALVYICQTGDSRQQMRQRLFAFWFNSASRKDDYAFLSADVRDAEGQQNYAAVIVRLDNPAFQSVVREFYSTVMTLRNKPD